MKMKIILVAVIILNCFYAFTENWDVIEQSGNLKTEYNIEIKTQKDNNIYETTFITPSKIEDIRYTLENGAFYKKINNGEIIINRNGKYLEISGKELICPDIPWYGNFPIAIRTIVLLKRNDIDFIVLDEKKLRITIMNASVSYDKNTKLPIVKISLKGFLGVLWSVTFYTDEDGNIIKYIGNNGPGTSTIIQYYHRL
jgi:hypothetical protein